MSYGRDWPIGSRDITFLFTHQISSAAAAGLKTVLHIFCFFSFVLIVQFMTVFLFKAYKVLKSVIFEQSYLSIA